MSTGAILYRGPSEINGRPIAVIMTYRSTNAKTGPLPQTWVLPADEHPVEARRNRTDTSVCGGCPFAGNGGCYVDNRGLGAVYKTYAAGRYGTFEDAEAWLQRNQPRAVRLGSWGDPAAVPLEVWERLEVAASHSDILGYTHQWRSLRVQPYRRWLMASVESEKGAGRAHMMGWRTFRVSESGTPIEGEVVCPATTKGVTCAACRICTGERILRPAGAASRQVNVVLAAHGSRPVLSKIRAALNRVEAK